MPPPRSPFRPRRRALVAGALAAAAAAATAVAVAPAAAVPAPPAGWTLVWGDDFTGPAGARINEANWLYATGTGYPGGAPNWGTGEVETMTSDTRNVSLDGAGHLAITPLRDSAGRWTSARIETRRTDFQPPAGGRLRIEASIQQPNVSGAEAAGYWPAFWALGGPARPVGATNWPGVGEIDMLEAINGRESHFATLHCGTGIPGTCNEPTGLGSGERPCPGCKTSFHTYGVEWDRSSTPNALRWYRDGQVFFTLTRDQVDRASWDNALNHGYFLILNVAMGGGFPAAFGGGPTAATRPGVPMLVDYVAVYSSGGGTPPTTPPPGGGVSAYSTIQAESYAQAGGIQQEPTTDVGGGQNIGWIANGDWAAYPNVDFGSTPARQFSARVASGAAGGVSGLVEVRLDSRTAPPVGSFAIANTGGWQSWRTVPGTVSGITGRHTVYLTFTSGQPADFVNVNWFTFAR
jgi:beta-glucanase (GH16 family)